MKRGVKTLHLLLDRGGVRQPLARAGRSRTIWRPLSPYGWSKLMTEQMLRDASAAHSLTHVGAPLLQRRGRRSRLRTWPADAGRDPSDQVAVEAALGRSRAHLDVYGTDYDTPDGTCVRDFIHVSDLASRASSSALDNYLSGRQQERTLIAATAAAIRSARSSKAVRGATGYDFPVAFVDRRPGDIAVSIAATDRIHKLLDWKAEFDDLDIIITHALAWERHAIHSIPLRQG